MDGAQHSQEIDHLVSVDTESAALGAMMMDALAATECAAILQPDHFTLAVHRWVFQFIAREIEKRDGLADPAAMVTTMAAQMRADGIADASKLLGNMLAAAAPLEAALDYAKLVRDAHSKRQLRDACERARSIAAQPETDYMTALEGAQAAVMEASHSADPFDTMTLDMALLEAVAPEEQALGGRSVHTGLAAVDQLVGSLAPGSHTIIAARPSMGKTVAGCELALEVALAERARKQDAGAVLFVSLEMTKRQLGQRLGASMAHRVAPEHAPTYFALDKETLTQAQHDAYTDGRLAAAGLP